MKVKEINWKKSPMVILFYIKNTEVYDTLIQMIMHS